MLVLLSLAQYDAERSLPRDEAARRANRVELSRKNIERDLQLFRAEAASKGLQRMWHAAAAFVPTPAYVEDLGVTGAWNSRGEETSAALDGMADAAIAVNRAIEREQG